MASGTHTLVELDDVTNVVYTLIGQTDKGSFYKNRDRSLALPQTLNFDFNIGNPGSNGNDRLKIALANSIQNSSTGQVKTGSLKIEVSVPRDSEWTTTDTEDLLAQVVDLLTNANIAVIADGATP